MTIHLISYRPIIHNKKGSNVAQSNSIHNYVYNSIRREPDFEKPLPGISSLCRNGQVAPHLKVGDTVVYMRINGRHYQTLKEHHRCLVAVMEVIHVFQDHKIAAACYQQSGIVTPYNCINKNNPPLDSQYTAMDSKEVRYAEAEYIKRSRQNSQYVVCKPFAGYPELNSPSYLFDRDLNQILMPKKKLFLRGRRKITQKN
ncbi:hypothetical protein F7731_18065 [Cytobacillus depressus]|uniref:Uncharacterized protein n=1 Tax=Cytobacillus depressus TaxID=1602942 RepID=A0A6L3V175_9BACI|nr:hypothetical protein [Cytobacillus depressus]KAB2331499.1 hypothetical protein F7731_18065 [Cytobacillus depressus]